MIDYLLKRPISVFVSFATVIMLAMLAYFRLPTSLLPDIPIPEIIVQASADNLSSEEMEHAVITPLRQRLMQMGHLSDIRSITQNESGQIRLVFDYGTRMDLAFVDANEKVDAAMNSLPRGTKRPLVTKASATDLPVFDLVMSFHGDTLTQPVNEDDFIQMCELAQNVIKRRLEQLPEVSMVDMSGLWERELFISVDKETVASLGITEKDIERVFNENNIETYNAVVRDGGFEFNIRFSSSVRTAEDVENLYLKHGGRILRMKDIAHTEFKPGQARGGVFYNGKQALVLSIIKHPDVKMDELQENVDRTLANFRKAYPKIEFHITHNQSELLDVTIGSLKQDLLLGLLLIFLVTLFFLRDVRLPFLIGTTLFVSLVISFGLFYIADLSLNIISLVGLILSVGMMIDNAIIVTDNITQYRQAGLSIDHACIKGTQEVITPMLSSMLTTIAVFLPLVFIGGISGAIFYDQALSITLSLAVSYVTAITFLPVFYKMVFRGKITAVAAPRHTLLFTWYEKCINRVFAHKVLTCMATVLTFPLCYFLFVWIDKEKMPYITHQEAVVEIDWNESIHLGENVQRANRLIAFVGELSDNSVLFTGQQQFLIGNKRKLGTTEAKLYAHMTAGNTPEAFAQAVDSFFKRYYPNAFYTVAPPETVFEDLFSTSEADLTIQLVPYNELWNFSSDSLARFAHGVEQDIMETVSVPPYSSHIQINLEHEKMLLSGVSADEVIHTIKNSLGENKFATLRNYTQYIPVQIERDEKKIADILNTTFVKGGSGSDLYPLREFVTLSYFTAPKEIVAGTNGIYMPLQITDMKNGDVTAREVQRVMREHPEWKYLLSGAYLQNKEMIGGLVMVLFISIIMMYLILTAQFESFLQPLILLAEIPIDIAAALLCLMACGHTLNLMSAIGIVVTCGVIVNDSILKINVINELRAESVPLMEAIHEAGKKRLRSIVITSLTSILALVPILFSSDMGSELQKPFAIAMIGAMTIGTLVSLFIIPLIYALIYKGKSNQATQS